jgi:hypothetical protein
MRNLVVTEPSMIEQFRLREKYPTVAVAGGSRGGPGVCRALPGFG